MYKKKYYDKSFELGIIQTNLDKLKDKIFGIENNLDELNGIDFKKGCYVGQENTSRIKLRNKLFIAMTSSFVNITHWLLRTVRFILTRHIARTQHQP